MGGVIEMDFNDRLMELRKSRGWSQEELGDKLEVTRQTVSKWELGQTTPEMNKLAALSELFHISLDELISGKEQNTGYEQNSGYGQRTEKEVIYIEQRRHYEYKSKRTVKGLPLVHINVGYGMYHARGILAIGNIATGLVAIGAISAGLISLGAVSVGLLALAALSVGILSLGAVAVGGFAVGGIAVGYLALGGLAVGTYSIGGCALAEKIALGGYASGHIAAGESVKGTVEFLTKNHKFSDINGTELKQAILDKYPDTWKWIVDLFTSLVG
jgi:transcriptional regulator with XRE-family HTH domain